MLVASGSFHFTKCYVNLLESISVKIGRQRIVKFAENIEVAVILGFLTRNTAIADKPCDAFSGQ